MTKKIALLFANILLFEILLNFVPVQSVFYMRLLKSQRYQLEFDQELNYIYDMSDRHLTGMHSSMSKSL